MPPRTARIAAAPASRAILRPPSGPGTTPPTVSAVKAVNQPMADSAQPTWTPPLNWYTCASAERTRSGQRSGTDVAIRNRRLTKYSCRTSAASPMLMLAAVTVYVSADGTELSLANTGAAAARLPTSTNASQRRKGSIARCGGTAAWAAIRRPRLGRRAEAPGGVPIGVTTGSVGTGGPGRIAVLMTRTSQPGLADPM